MAQSLREPELLVEEEVLPRARVAALFPNAELISTLIERGILSPDRNGALRVRFVGVAVAAGRSFQVLPKIFSASPANASIMHQVIRALRRYARWKPKHHEETPFLDVRAHLTNLNALAIADWLIRDYLTTGIYRRLREQEELGGRGQISWRRTIERTTPLLYSGRPVYVDTVTRSSTNDHDHFISRLHRQIVDVASKTFGGLLGYAPIVLDHEPFEPFNDMPPLAFCQTRVSRELQEAFSDRATHLLPMLIAWLSAREKARHTDLALYGTSTFHRVWEEACSLALGNERDLWRAHIPRPQWYSAEGSMQAADTFEPDIVTRIQVDGEEQLLIADAKYYRLSMPPNLGGQPGVNDVAKQLWYEQCLGQPARDRGLSRTHNIFVVPGPERDDSFWSDGQVSFAGLPHTTVKIKRLSGLQALKRYADGTPLDSERMRATVVAA